MALYRNWLTLAIMLLLVGTTNFAHAQSAPAPTPAVNPLDKPAPKDLVCTSFQERLKDLDGKASTTGGAQDGLLTDIYKFIKDTVDKATEKLFSAFTKSSIYQEAVFGAMSLMIVIFGVGFTIGVVQLSFQQAFIRLIKLAIVGALISPSGWQYFNDTVVQFFANGTDELVRGVMAIGTGGSITAPAGASPFYELDKLANFIIQPDTIIMLLGSLFAGGPFGLSMGVLLGLAVYTFVSLLIAALRTYAVSYVARALILGVAPIFFIFLLFDKTKTMFTSWVNALVNLSLQPILLFTFLSFFIVMMNSASQDMLGVDLCWAEFKQGEGTNNKLAFWRFKDPKTGNPIVGDMTWKGSIDCIITGSDKCQEFPINIIDILTFLILMYIAQRFASITARMAADLSNAYVTLDAAGRLEQFIQQQTAGKGGEPPVNPRSQRSGATKPPPSTARPSGATTPPVSPTTQPPATPKK